MLRVTLRSLLARKLRLLLSGFAIILGVAFLSGTLVLTDSLGKVFDTLFTTVYEGTAVSVRGVSSLAGGASDERAPVPASLLAAVSRVPGVAEAVGTVSGYAQLIGPDGKAVTTSGAPTFGVDWSSSDRQRPLTLRQGRAPVGPDEVGVDAATARKAHVVVGDTVKVLLKGPPRTFHVVAIIGFGKQDNLAGASLLAFSLPVAQEILGTPGTYEQIGIAASAGVTENELRSRVAQVLPAGYEAVTSAQTTQENSSAIKNGLGFFNTALLIFAGISLFVGGFLIFNTFSMLVAQRTRELALMRALGASRAQVTGSVLLEAVLVGLLSSLVGFGLGIAVAIGLQSALGALGIDLPSGETVIAPRTLIAALLVGVGVSAIAALVPARKAARVSPVEAMRDSGPAEDRSLRKRGLGGGGLLVAGVVVLAIGLANGTLALVGLGVGLSFLGVATLSPFVARPVAGLLGAPFAHFGVPGRLGRANAVRSPRRTSATAAALMIGLALVAAVSVLGSSLKKSAVEIVRTSLGADYVVHTQTFVPFSPTVATSMKGKPGIDAVASFSQGRARIGSGVTSVRGVEASQLVRVLKLEVTGGDLEAIDTGALAVSQKVADAHGWKLGTEVPVTWSKTGLHPLRIGAIFGVNQFAGDYLVSQRLFDANTTQHLTVVVAIRTAEGSDPAQTRAVVDAAIKEFPNLVVQDQAEFVAAQAKQVDSLLNVITVLLVLSVLIAVLGIVNTLALSVIERTRELGLLRAVGLQRRQLRRMIRVESVIIAVYGALLGLLVGTAFGWALVKALHDQGVTEFALPVGRLTEVVVVAALAGVVAAALPARRAARLDVLAAIAASRSGLP